LRNGSFPSALNPVAFSVGQVWRKVNGGWVGRYSLGVGWNEQARRMEGQTQAKHDLLSHLHCCWSFRDRMRSETHILPKDPVNPLHPVLQEAFFQRMWKVKTRRAWFKVQECWLRAWRGPLETLSASNCASSCETAEKKGHKTNVGMDEMGDNCSTFVISGTVNHLND
jgi:hypothetical protein